MPIDEMNRIPVLVIVWFAIAVLVWTSQTRFKKKREGLAIDNFFSKAKVPYGLLEVFSNIKWPGSLETIVLLIFFQLNVREVAPVYCQLNTFWNHFTIWQRTLCHLLFLNRLRSAENDHDNEIAVCETTKISWISWRLAQFLMYAKTMRASMVTRSSISRSEYYGITETKRTDSN